MAGEVAPIPRAPSRAEKEVLEHLLAFEFPGVETLRRDLDEIVVEPSCHCGCASIRLIPERASGSPESSSVAPLNIQVMAEGASPAGGMILWIADSRLAELEVFSVGDDPLSPMPSTDRILVDVEDGDA